MLSKSVVALSLGISCLLAAPFTFARSAQSQTKMQAQTQTIKEIQLEIQNTHIKKLVEQYRILNDTPNASVQTKIKNQKLYVYPQGTPAERLALKAFLEKPPVLTLKARQSGKAWKTLGPVDHYLVLPAVTQDECSQLKALGLPHIQTIRSGYGTLLPHLSLLFLESDRAYLKKVTAAHIDEKLGFFIHGTLVSSPIIQAAVGNEATIHGNFTVEEVLKLAQQLNSDPTALQLKFKTATGWEALNPQPTLKKVEAEGITPSDHSVALSLNPAAQAQFTQFTAQHIGEPLGIFVQDTLSSSPIIRAPIQSGELVISGYTAEKAQALATLLEAHPESLQFKRQTSKGWVPITGLSTGLVKAEVKTPPTYCTTSDLLIYPHPSKIMTLTSHQQSEWAVFLHDQMLHPLAPSKTNPLTRFVALDSDTRREALVELWSLSSQWAPFHIELTSP